MAVSAKVMRKVVPSVMRLKQKYRPAGAAKVRICKEISMGVRERERGTGAAARLWCGR